MKLGLQLGYWAASPPSNAGELVLAADKSGFDSVFAAESWGSDAFSPLAWWGAQTSSVRLGTSVAQLSARSPAGTAMHALTMDHLSGGRFVLGLGVSGPQVVEGWYGAPFAKPLARTREYVRIIRDVLAREQRVTNEGPHYPLPYNGSGATGLGKSLRPITHPLRAELPIWLGAEGPRNVAQTAEIADGWIAIYYSPGSASMYQEWLEEGFARPGARRAREEFEVAASAQVVVTEDAAAQYEVMRHTLALYIGGMGAAEMNFHADVFSRMGFAEVVADIGRYYLGGDKNSAARAVPDELIDEVAIIGDRDTVRGGLRRWEKAGVDTMLVSCADAESVRQLAELAENV